MKIKTWRDPYDAGFSPTRPTEIELYPGLTVLVGCNGAGKTTLLNNIKSELKKEKVPCHMFNNLSDGGTSAFSSIISGCSEFADDDMNLGLTLWNASEGEAIKLNIGRQSTLYKEFLKTGYFKTRTHKMQSIFSNEKQPEVVEDNRRVLLFDATDSGMSVDSICEIKELFKLILEEAKEQDLEMYIIISANEYELARNERCFDVNTGKYRTFSGYESYRKFILNSRKKKEKRIEQQMKWREKESLKEKEKYEKLKEKIEKKVKEVREKAVSEGRELTRQEEWKIKDLERELDNFRMDARFNKFEKIEF